MDNKDYFKYSLDNEDEIVDFSKQEGVVVITKEQNEPSTELMKANNRLIELITSYKALCFEVPNHNVDFSNKIIDEIALIIETTKSINYSAFCIYLQVIGYSYNLYMSEKDNYSLDEKRNLIKTFLELYIKNRHQMYLMHGYSNQVLQVSSDSASSRRKGKTGIEKIEEIIKPLDFKKAISVFDLESSNFCYLLPDKGDTKIFNDFLIKNDIKYEFRKNRDAKNPDMFLKIKDNFYIIEHKLTNGSGGSQNLEINEIIQFISYKEDNNDWHYISCLQGNYFIKLRDNSKEPKTKAQLDNINKNLSDNIGNYFLNGKGLEKFINDQYLKANKEHDDIVGIENLLKRNI